MLAFAAVGVAIFLLAFRATTDQGISNLVLGSVGLAFVGLAVAFLAVRVVLDKWALNPVAQLSLDVEKVLHVGSGPEIEIPAGTAVTQLGQLVNDLARQHVRTREESARAVSAARAAFEQDELRLEAILRDLAEGVILVGADHRIALFNRAAHAILSKHGRIGLGRAIYETLERTALTEAIERLAQGTDDETAQPVVPVILASADGRLKLDARLTSIAGRSGFVISFADPTGEALRAHTLPSREPFYDFDLLDRVAPAANQREALLRELSYVVFDTETTGLEPFQGDEIVQIGAVRIVNGRLIDGEAFDRLVNPGRTIPARATRIHGITDDMVAAAPDVGTTLPAFRDFVGDAVLVAQNAAFDMAFLSRATENEHSGFGNAVLDTMLLSIFMDGVAGDHTLDGLAARFGVDSEGRHTALGDARVTAAIFLRQLDLLEARGVTRLGAALDAMRKASRMVPTVPR